MGGRKWTREQGLAISTRDKTLLVSAAAGSGKTATLTERIIETLLDMDNPTSITELLVVTFTNAAASEMRQRITDSLKAACAEHPDNKHLARQLMLLPTAKIKTIDSFCSDLVRMNSDKVGIAPNYRVLDTAEAQLLAFSIFEGMINSIYDGEMEEVASPEDFEALAECIASAQNMQCLSEVLFQLYEKTSADVDQFDRLSSYREACNPERLACKEDIPFIDFYIKRLGELCEYFELYIDSIISELSCGSEVELAYTDAFCSDKEFFSTLRGMRSYDAIREALNGLEWKSVPSKKRGVELTELQISARERRDVYKKAVSDIRAQFSYTDGDLLYCFSGLYSRLGTLIAVLKRFDSLFMAEKRRRGGFTYNDVERFAYQTLWDGDERTDAALSQRAQYKFVYIDEYQDVNELQDKIFEAVSRIDNRFMVGDIKQSIYGFRSAEPDIFAGMKKSLPQYEEGTNAPALGLFMSENFRCDEGIIDFVNGVFDKVFGVIGESIGYLPEDRLKYGKGAIQSGDIKPVIPEVTVVDRAAKSDEEDAGSLEPRAVAELIKKLLDEERLNNGSTIRKKDIAIVMRKTEGRAQNYSTALAELGIEAAISGEKNFFLNREVLLALCLLNSIDNPLRDIYLTGLMRSPLYNFTADELLLIASKKCGSMYASLLKYTEENPEFKKGRCFIADIKRYRRIAESASAAALLNRLYRETGLLALAAKNGGKDNLTLLFNYAKDFEAREYKGLYAFISFINELVANKTQFDTKQGSSDADEVNIVTTHSSKGLEYPVVIFVESAAGLYPSTGRNPSNIRYSKGFGISFPLRTEGGSARVEGIVDHAIKDFGKKKIFEEEMRVLYVALTRARERLYVFGKAEAPENYIEKMREYGEILTPYSVGRLGSSLDVICTARPPAYYKTYSIGTDCDADNTAENNTVDEISENKEAENEGKGYTDRMAVPAVTREELIARFNYKYPLAHLTELPEKMSVSRLSPAVLDGTEEDPLGTYKAFNIQSGKANAESASGFYSEDDADIENLGVEHDESANASEKRTYPDFYTGKPADESAKRGIATHLFMQFCDLKNLEQYGAQAELERLAERGFLSSSDKERVRLAEIKLFTRSTLFGAMLGADKIYRELRFNVRMPAELFTEDKDRRRLVAGRKILVQGVIDCIIRDGDGGLHIVDYKTDRLTRAELSDESLAAKTLTEKHKTQLGYYRIAVKSIFGEEPKSVEIYSLPLGKSIVLGDF